MELPNFHIPHSEKIEWMIEQRGWAVEPVPPRTDTDPPVPAYAYTVGFPERFGFPEVLVFGLTPVATTGLLELVAGMLDGGTEIPMCVALTGLFDNDLRCMFLPVPADVSTAFLGTAVAWRRGGAFDTVQLLWPDRNGFLPHEVGFDRRVVSAQPVVGALG